MAKRSNSADNHNALYLLAFVRNDLASMQQQVAWATDQQGEGDLLLGLEGNTHAFTGQLRLAGEFSQRAVASANRAGKKETGASYEADAAIREALFGNRTLARLRATVALHASNGTGVRYGAALALALAGDSAQPESLSDDLEKRSPEDTVLHVNRKPTLHAQLALNAGDSARAIEILKAATPYELGNIGSDSMYPVHVRGEAYLAAHQGSQAAAEFQKILDHSGIVLNEPIGALAHLGLARAYAMLGDTAKAKTAYHDFLTLWKDADPDIPILNQAKAEYAKLQ